MNILVDDLPEAIEIDGVEYTINFDFKTGLQCILDMESNDLIDDEKALLLLRRIYGDNIPTNESEALRLAVKFLDGGEEPEAHENPLENDTRVYSFEKDASLIYAAFQQTHGIDLQKADLHWWQFLALFHDLGADTAFCSIVNLRRRISNGDATKEEREYAAKLGDAFYIDNPEDILSMNENENLALFELLSKEG